MKIKKPNLFKNNLLLEIQQILEKEKKSPNLAPQILSLLRQKLNFSTKQIEQLLPYIKEGKISFSDLSSISTLLTTHEQLRRYINPENILIVLQKGWSLETLLRLAKIFYQEKLDQNPEYANFKELISHPNIAENEVEEIARALKIAKKQELSINQNKILNFLFYNPPVTKKPMGLINALILSKKHNLGIQFEHLKQVALYYDKDPMSFTNLYKQIRDNELPISLEDFIDTMSWTGFDPLEEAVQWYNNLVKEGLQDVEFNALIDFIKQKISPSEIARLYLQLKENNVKVDFAFLNTLVTNKVDINTIFPALTYASAKMDFEEFKKIVSTYLQLRKKAIENFNLFNFARALDIGKTKFDLDYKTILNDYINGVSVWEILDLMQYAQNNNVSIAYPLAKILFSQGKLKELIDQAINPQIIEIQGINATTKDNIQLEINLNLYVTLNIANYFKGSGEDELIKILEAALVEEILQYEDFETILKSLDKIANNTIKKLNSNEESGLYQYIKNNKYKPVKLIITSLLPIKETYKEYEKLKHMYEYEKEKLELELRRLRSEVELLEAWAKSKDLKYLVLKGEEKAHYRHLPPGQEEDH